MSRDQSSGGLARLSTGDVRWAVRICNILIALIAAATLAAIVL